MPAKITCRCGEVNFDGLTFKRVSVGQFAQGYCNLKCKTCGFWMTKIDARIFMGVPLIYNFKKMYEEDLLRRADAQVAGGI